MRHAVFIEIDGADGPPLCVGLNAMNVAIGADFTAAGFFRHADDCCKRAGLSADFAPKAFAEAALDTRTAAGAWLRKNRHRRGEGMPAELARGALENDSAGLHRQRRHGIGFRTGRIKGAGTRKTGDTDFPFDFGVVRLQVRISDGPIHEICAGNRADFAALDEVNFVKAPVIRGEMDARAADHPAINKGMMVLGLFLWSLAEGRGLQLWVIGELMFA